MFNPDAAGDALRDALIGGRAARGSGQATNRRLRLGGPGRLFRRARRFGRRALRVPPELQPPLPRSQSPEAVVFDSSIVLIGGANIDQNYMSDRGPDRWRDLWLRVEGPEAAMPGRYFDTLFRGRPHNIRCGYLRRQLAEYGEWRGALQWKFSGPSAGATAGGGPSGRTSAAASSSGHGLRLFRPPGAMLRRIGQLARRGRARIITAAKSDNNATIAAARHNYTRLLRRRVEMYEYQPAKLHIKLAIVDDIVHIGSSNFDIEAFTSTWKLCCGSRMPRSQMRCAVYVERELAGRRFCITPELHRHPRSSLWRRIKWTVSYFLVNVMDYTVTRRLNFRVEG